MTEVIGVRFRGGCKEYYFDPHGIAVEAGEFVIVETAQGTEYAQCLTGNHEVDDSAVVQPLRALVRLATENDRRTMEYNRQREKDAFGICQKKIAERGLDMKLVRVECNFDGSKIVFFFTSDGRVDFRELVRDLAGVFRARIELRQIGVRDEAKMLGGLGICGRPFCCAQFLDDFVPVSIKMAKTQNLSLNPTKISGACGRLMCCLKYEQAAYEDASKRMPKNDSFVLTPDGPGNVSAVNLIKETVNVRLDDSNEGAKCYHNCEVCVLRNGKGSRDGIEIPAERPARYTAPDAEDELAAMPSPVFRALEISEPAVEPMESGAPAASEDSGEKREQRRRRGGRSHRGGRGRGGEKRPQDGGVEATPTKTEKEKGDKPERGEKKPAPARKPEGERRARREQKEQQTKPAAPAGEGAKSAENSPRPEGTKPHRRSHRGGRGRRRSGGGNGGTPPAAPSAE